jgi:Rrf2 family protein
MDTKFAVAVHALVFISESTDAKTSETISRTLNTNASYVRKILSGLAKAGMITSASKARDCSLLKEPKDIRLSDLYEAVEPGVSKLNMSLSQNSNTDLFICRCEKPVMEELFQEMERSVNTVLQDKTLQDVIDSIHQRQEIGGVK